MPYIEEEKKIISKLVNVTKSVGLEGRQQALLDMRTYPEEVKKLYIEGLRVFVEFDSDAIVCIGNIQEKYRGLIQKYHSQLISWNITGGVEVLEGYTTREGFQRVHNLGINIVINLLDEREIN